MRFGREIIQGFNVISRAIFLNRRLAFQLSFAILPLFLAAFASSNGQPLMQTAVYLAFSLAFYAIPLILIGNTVALASIYFVLGTGAWIFLAFIYHSAGYP